jgi:hypothetical protein
MSIPKEFYDQRKKEAIGVWVKMFTLWKSGVKPRDIARRFVNEQTGQPYTREHVYLVLRTMKSLPIKELQIITNQG